MNKILVLFAHPVFERSRVHRSLIDSITSVNGITIHDLYENYPEFDIDVEKEKNLLLQHDVIVWQHPLFWYSGPALLKQWQDLVLEHGWAYGQHGHALDGKRIFNAITSGGEMQAYETAGFQRSTIREFLLPFERTAQLCRMIYLPPFWVPGTHTLNAVKIEEYSLQYKNLLIGIRDGNLNEPEILTVPFLNKWVTSDKKM
jgi:glutathione-regulated potassium-efflux system ancillary protein KefG